MKKILLMLSLLIATNANAQTAGCYLDFFNPSACSTSVITCGTVLESNYVAWGYTVGRLCEDVIYQYSNYLDCANHYNALTDVYNYQVALVRKLRKRCGRACQRIR